MRAELSNPNHPELGVAAIHLPISEWEYDHVMQELEALNIGDAVARDCRLGELASGLESLKVLECQNINIDELDYLAKRLDSLDEYEVKQFEAAAARFELTDMTDLINLTFCSQQVTVISDFSCLEEVGRDHYLSINGGCAGTGELDNLDGYETALLLIGSGTGVVTPYGVIYDNGMKLEQLYDGTHFPGYLYRSNVMMVSLTSRSEPEDTKNITWLYLPAARAQIDHAILRSGIKNESDMRFRPAEDSLLTEIRPALDFDRDSIYALNDLALAVAGISKRDRVKLGAAVDMTDPKSAEQIQHLAENLDMFEFAPGAHNLAEYGRYMIQKSGHFSYDPNLEEYYDYEKYGRQHIDLECGTFTDRGYISYQGAMSLDELMMEDPAEQHQQEMGGM